MALVSLNASASVVKESETDRFDSEQAEVSALNHLFNSTRQAQGQIDRFDSRKIERTIGHCHADRIVNYVKGIFGLNQLDTLLLLRDVYPHIQNKLYGNASSLDLMYSFQHNAIYFEEDVPEDAKKNAQFLIDRAKRRDGDILKGEQELCRLIDDSVGECAKTVQQLLEKADVASFQELLRKSNHMWYLKQQAQYTYLKSFENIELKKAIDVKTMPQDDETLQCITGYWAALGGNEPMIAHHIRGEGILREAYVQMRTVFLKIMVRADEENTCLENINVGLSCRKSLEHCLQAGKDILQHALNELINVGIKTDSVSFKYFETKAKTVISTWLKKNLRKILEPRYQCIAAQYNGKIKEFDRWVARIPKFVEDIETFNRQIAELDPNDDDQKKRIECLQSKLDCSRENIELLNRHTSREYALKYLGEDPEDYLPLLKECEKTEYEFSTNKVCKLKWGKVLLTKYDHLIDPDVHLPLSTTEDMLMSLLKERDLACLNIQQVSREKKQRYVSGPPTHWFSWLD